MPNRGSEIADYEIITTFPEIRPFLVTRNEERAERFQKELRKRKRQLSAAQLKQAMKKLADMLVVPIALSSVMLILLWATSCFEVMP